MLTSEIVSYYQNLLVIQYKALPKAKATIGALATETVADQIFDQVLNGFNLDTAVGAQLDILASYVGAPRRIYGFSPDVPYFALPDYDDTPPANSGFASYDDTSDPLTYWLSYFSSATIYVLTDGQLRSLIKYLIAVHKSDHTLESIDAIMQTFFGAYATMADNGDMTITYTHLLTDPNVLFGIVVQIGALPHPGGVEVIVNEV